MSSKTGYQVTTYRFRLYCDQEVWLGKTKEIYNQVLEFYYRILQKEPKFESNNRQKIMRQLELWTIGNQKKENVKYPFPYGKVPLYFRRAAINDAIRLYRSYESGRKRDAAMRPAGRFQASPIFYKGMYKDLSERQVFLKLWSTEKWVWSKCKLDACGRKWPAEAEILSPVLKLEGGKAMFHIPVCAKVADVRTVKERFQENGVICSAAFPNNDCMAVLTVLERDGNCKKSQFIRGGNQFAYRRKQLLNRLRKNQENMGKKTGETNERADGATEENKHLKEKLRNLSEYYAHQVSHQIVSFCKEQKVSIIVVPNYGQPLDLNRIGYLSASNYDWIGRKIIQYVRYKAFGQGIVVTSVNTKDIASVCYICGQPVQRFNKNKKPGKNYYGGKNYICPNGHRGNASFNIAMNVGRRFLKSQAEMQG